MKRRISDLLDGIRADGVELKTKTPLSSQRIKELTMSKITKNEKKGSRAAFRILAVAAAISLMTVTAFAAEKVFGVGDLFRNAMNQRLEEEHAQYEKSGLNVQETVSDAQVGILNELGKNFQPQTYTADGTTITLTAAYGYENVMCMYFHVVAPEGTVLPDGILYDFFSSEDMSNGFIPLTIDDGAPYDFWGHSVDFQAMTDDDPTDNVKDFIAVIHGQTVLGGSFSDGYGKHFNMTGIYEQVVDQYGDEDGYTPIVKGDFSFAIGSEALEIPWVELDVEGLTYGGHKTRTWTHDSPCLGPCEEYLTGETDPESGLPIHSESRDYLDTMKSMWISPFAVKASAVNEAGSESTAQFQIIMKDGTSPVELGGGCFLVPIDLNEIDYILIGDPEIDSAYKVYLPQ